MTEQVPWSDDFDTYHQQLIKKLDALASVDDIGAHSLDVRDLLRRTSIHMRSFGDEIPTFKGKPFTVETLSASVELVYKKGVAYGLSLAKKMIDYDDSRIEKLAETGWAINKLSILFKDIGH